MCFIFHDKDKTRQKQIVEQDEGIICYKTVFKDKDTYRSVYYKFIYEFNKLYTHNKDLIFVDNYLYGVEKVSNINEGFHSYTSIPNSPEVYYYDTIPGHSGMFKRYPCVVQCRLPKGTQYYISYMHREIVSDRIIVEKLIKEFNNI